MKDFEVAPQAVEDLFLIWCHIAEDNEQVADRVQSQFCEKFAALATTPGIGHRRIDLTKKPVLFFTLYSYLIVYDPKADPLRIVAVVHGSRNLRRVLRGRDI
jgi:plasmid stabilization system protein ParE